jgi:hypothetical protein
MRRSFMRRDDLYVADLVDTTRAIREYLDSTGRAQWDEDRVLRDAVLYRPDRATAQNLSTAGMTRSAIRSSACGEPTSTRVPCAT